MHRFVKEPFHPLRSDIRSLSVYLSTGIRDCSGGDLVEMRRRVIRRRVLRRTRRRSSALFVPAHAAKLPDEISISQKGARFKKVTQLMVCGNTSRCCNVLNSVFMYPEKLCRNR